MLSKWVYIIGNTGKLCPIHFTFVRQEGRLATHPTSPASKSGSRLPIFNSVCLGLAPGQIDSPYLFIMSWITIPREEYCTNIMASVKRSIVMRMPPLKTVCIRGQKFYSHMYASEFRLLKYRISSITVGSIFFFAQKGGDHAGRAITSIIAPGKSCPNYFVLLSHQIKKWQIRSKTRYIQN